jgi:hypothetical protein
MKIRKHLTYANVAATAALVVAVGGGTTAIALSGRNSVHSDDIKNGNVTARDLGEIRVMRRLFTLPDAAADNNWTSTLFRLPCPKGTRILSGGGHIAPVGNGRDAITLTDIDGNAWSVQAAQDTGQDASVLVTALCLKGRPGPPRLDQ